MDDPNSGLSGKAADRPGDRPGDGSSGWLDRHLWEIQPLRDVALIAAVIGLIYLGALASVVTVPLLLALLLAYLINPVVVWLTRRHAWFTRRRAVASIMLTAILVVVAPATAGITIGLIQVWNAAVRLEQGVAGVIKAMEDPSFAELLGPRWRAVYDWLLVVRERAEAADLDRAVLWVQENGQEIAGALVEGGAGAISAAATTAGTVVSLGFLLFLTGFFLFFVSAGWPGVVAFGRSLVPETQRERVAGLVGQMDRAVSGFVRGRLTIALIQAVVFSVGYTAIGVPGAVIVGIAVAFLSIVPYLAIVGIPVSIVLLWLENHAGIRGSWWYVVLAPLLVYNVGQALDDYVLTPTIQGRELDMDIPTILFATFAGGALLGVYGLLLAIPLAACVKILVREIIAPRFRAWAAGTESDPLPVTGHRPGRD